VWESLYARHHTQTHARKTILLYPIPFFLFPKLLSHKPRTYISKLEIMLSGQLYEACEVQFTMLGEYYLKYLLNSSAWKKIEWTVENQVTRFLPWLPTAMHSRKEEQRFLSWKHWNHLKPEKFPRSSKILRLSHSKSKLIKRKNDLINSQAPSPTPTTP
jgi:hypothetical protein